MESQEEKKADTSQTSPQIDNNSDNKPKLNTNDQAAFNFEQTQETRIMLHSPVVEALSELNDNQSFDRSRLLAGSAKNNQ